jgi:EmrB/QacA subfamily drug resistance transporter
MIALFVAALDQTVVGTAIPRIVADLGGLHLLPWVFTSYMLTSTTAVPIAGKLGDQFGRKPLFLIGLVLFFGSSLAAGAAQSMPQLVVARGVQGLGGGVIMATTFAVVADLYSPLERGRVTGLIAGTFGLASVIGPVVGGALTDAISWRWVFYINLPIIAIAFFVILVAVPFIRIGGPKPKIDVIGAVLLVNTMVPLLLALVWGGDRIGWQSSEMGWLLGISGLMLVLFIVAEANASDPMLPPRLFLNRTFTVSALATLFSGAGMFGALTMVPLFLQGVRSIAATSSGSLTAPMSIGIVVSSALGGLLVSRTGRYRLQAIVGMSVVTAGLAAFSLIDRSTSEFTIVRNMVIVGLGMGATFPVFSVAVQNALPIQLLGVATSSVQFFRSVGGTLGVAVFTGIMLNRFRDGVAEVAVTAPIVSGKADAFLNEQGVAQVRAAYEAAPATASTPFDVILVAIQTPLADAIAEVFLLGTIIVGISVLITFLMPELPLRAISPAEQLRQMQQGATASEPATAPAPDAPETPALETPAEAPPPPTPAPAAVPASASVDGEVGKQLLTEPVEPAAEPPVEPPEPPEPPAARVEAEPEPLDDPQAPVTPAAETEPAPPVEQAETPAPAAQPEPAAATARKPRTDRDYMRPSPRA